MKEEESHPITPSALLQITGYDGMEVRDSILYLQDNLGRVVASSNQDVVIGRFKTMKRGEKILVELLSPEEYKGRLETL